MLPPLSQNLPVPLQQGLTPVQTFKRKIRPKVQFSPFPQSGRVNASPQSLVWEYETIANQNGIATPEDSGETLCLAFGSVFQCELPGSILTPAREVSQMAAWTQDTWWISVKKMEDQDKEIKELQKCVKENQSLSKEHFKAKVEQSNLQCSHLEAALSSTTEKIEKELDQQSKMVVKMHSK